MNDIDAKDDRENIVQSALAAGAGLADPKPQSLPGGRIGYIIPEGCRLHEIEPVNAELPDHVQASPKFEDTASFIEYVNRLRARKRRSSPAWRRTPCRR